MIQALGESRGSVDAIRTDDMASRTFESKEKRTGVAVQGAWCGDVRVATSAIRPKHVETSTTGAGESHASRQ